MAKFLEEFPDGVAKYGKPRGAGFVVSTAFHTEGCRKEKSRGERGPLWDLTRMKFLRGWSNEKIKEEWGRIGQDPDIERDMGGPKGSKERRSIPANLVGEVYREKKFSSWEEKGVGSRTKGNLKEAELEQARDEMRYGFHRNLDSEQFQELSKLSSPAKALLGAGEKKATSDVLRLVLHCVCDAPFVAMQGCSVQDEA